MKPFKILEAVEIAETVEHHLGSLERAFWRLGNKALSQELRVLVKELGVVQKLIIESLEEANPSPKGSPDKITRSS